MGRPTSFKSEYVEQARKLARLTGCRVHMALWLVGRRQVFAPRKRRRGHSPSHRIRNSMSARMWAALKGRSDGALFSRLGYTANQLIDHLERQFQPGMSWANYGAWHVDHRKPCAAFDLADPEQFTECWAINNLQPLWATDNIKKGARYGTT